MPNAAPHLLTGITSAGFNLGRRPIARAQEPESLRLSTDLAAAGGLRSVTYVTEWHGLACHR